MTTSASVATKALDPSYISLDGVEGEELPKRVEGRLTKTLAARYCAGCLLS
jgi:hypothetical protein